MTWYNIKETCTIVLIILFITIVLTPLALLAELVLARRGRAHSFRSELARHVLKQGR